MCLNTARVLWERRGDAEIVGSLGYLGRRRHSAESLQSIPRGGSGYGRAKRMLSLKSWAEQSVSFHSFHGYPSCLQLLFPRCATSKMRMASAKSILGVGKKLFQTNEVLKPPRCHQGFLLRGLPCKNVGCQHYPVLFITYSILILPTNPVNSS